MSNHSESTERILDTLKAASHLCESKIPGPLDVTIAGIIDEFCEMGTMERASLLESIDSKLGDLLLMFARRMAVLGVREKREDALFRGLIALVIENRRNDYRDTLVACSQLRHSAKKIGVNPERLFGQAAEYAAPKTAEMLRNFHNYPSSSLRGAGQKEAMSEDGFTYQWIKFKPRC